MHKMTKYENNKICCKKYYWGNNLSDESWIFNSESIRDKLKMCCKDYPSEKKGEKITA